MIKVCLKTLGLTTVAAIMLILKICVILCSALSGLKALTIVNLNGTWSLNSVNGAYTNLIAAVPGGIYTDLMKNNVIGDVFFKDNDVQTRWVSKLQWVYQRSFTADNDLLNNQYIRLVCDGLDTFATITLNGVKIGESQNMFVRYEFDVKPYLTAGVNSLVVTFDSPVIKAQQLYDVQSQSYIVPPECVAAELNGECHVNHIRKMQASFAWDWGPAFPSVGIWKNISIIGYDTSFINDVMVNSKELVDTWEFTVKTFFANCNNDLTGLLYISLGTDFDTVEINEPVNSATIQLLECSYVTTFQVAKNRLRLWWPNGMGEQPLYPLTVKFTSSDNIEVSSKSVRIGVRTVKLVQDERAHGRDFYFKVNGRWFFAKGTNMIPVSILPELAGNETKIRFLLESARKIHTNMIRIWGGGMYGSDILYDIADELGILIWQDFMFACSMYPTNKGFLKNVEDEVTHQMRRLQHHTSIFLWAANNENEIALRQNWYGTSRNFTLYKNDFVELYVNNIRKKALEIDNSIIFLTSSPTNGIQSEMEGYVAQDPQSELYGDVHYYNYQLDGWSKIFFPVPRFASEYGYQSFPSESSIMTATDNAADLSIYSDFMKHRQHLMDGTEKMLLLMGQRMALSLVLSKNYNRAIIFYSQIYQAMAIKEETENYRLWTNFTNLLGKGRTSGALYWQLNDVWIAPSWASIDFNNKWKMVHYFARNFFDPLIVTYYENLGVLQFYVVSDHFNPIANAKLKIYAYKWSSLDAQCTREVKHDISQGSKKVDQFFISTYLLFNCKLCTVATCFFRFGIFDENDKQISPDNYMYPLSLQLSLIESATVTISSVTLVKTGVYNVTVATNKVALFVWLDNKVRGEFSDNGFTMTSPQKSIFFFAAESQDPMRKFTVTHFKDNSYL